MTRNEAAALARLHALKFGPLAGDLSYLPKTDEEAKAFTPHHWVIEAILEAANGETPEQTVRRSAKLLGVKPEDLYTVHVTPKINEACNHTWEDGWCTECGVSFVRYTHSQMP